MFIRKTLVSLLFAVLCACAAPAQRAGGTFDQAYFNDRVAHIRSAAQQADVIVVATVMQVGAAPGYTSGYVKVHQHVRYQVDKVLKGYYQQPRIDVEHLLVGNSRHVKRALQGLDPNIFNPGAKLILLLKNVNTLFYQDVNAYIGTIDYSASNEQALLQAL